jgi:hypothetical protein
MTYQDQRNEDHPEAVRSDPVPVQRSAPDDEIDERDTDGDGVDDSVEADAGHHENSVAEAGYHDSVVTPDQDDDRRVEDVDATDTVDEDDRDRETEDEDRTGYDEPVLATPVDTEADRAGIDGSELDRERDEETDRDRYDGPVFPDSALTPVAFGAATAGGAAAAAAMATNRTDTRTDAEAVEDRTDEDRTAYDRVDEDQVDEDRVDEDRVDEDRVDGVPVEDDLAVVETETDTDHAADEHTELMPGEIDAEPVSALVAVEAAQGFRDRWREVQLRFVDDPRGAAGEAQGLAEEAADALVEAVAALRTDLGGWEATEGADTEQLRVVVRRYRDFLDRMLQS